MKRNLAGNTLVLWGMCCLLLGACSSANKTRVQASLTHSKADSPMSFEQTVDETYGSVFRLMAPLYLFYAQNDRWPASGQELQGLSQELGLTFDLSLYSQLDLRELQDGSLQVRFQLAPPGRAGGEFVLSKPDFEEDQGLLVQRRLMT